MTTRSKAQETRGTGVPTRRDLDMDTPIYVMSFEWVNEHLANNLIPDGRVDRFCEDG